MLLRASTLALAASLAVATPVAMAETAPTVAVEKVTTSKPAPAAAQDVSGYADREKQDTQAQNFQGGDVVVIGVSGAAILVLLLLLLLI